ncbi:MAG: type II toxin-antitoxin system VapC family toxin [Candidatus Saccharimonadales bacterium]
MIILLDTNVLVWMLNDPLGNKLGKHSKELLKNADKVCASSVNVLEIRIKSMLGKLEAPVSLLSDIESAGLNNLPFGSDHADAITQFPNLAKHDPFDRMLLAQAKAEGMQLLTSDRILLKLNLDFILNARQ